MLKHTSVDGLIVGGKTERSALLADFDIDGHDLKKRHREFLDGLVGAIRRSPLRPPLGIWVIHVTGRASLSGGNAHNEGLSVVRAGMVRDYIAARSPVPINFDSKAFGEEFPHDPKNGENELDRSVMVTAFPAVKIDPVPPPRIPGRKGPKRFDLRVTGYLATGFTVPKVKFASMTHWLVNLDITDVETDLSRQYFFDGWGAGGAGWRASRSIAVGVTQDFTAHRSFDETDFEGDAAFTFTGSKGLFRFGGSKFLLGLDAFPRGRIEGFVLPPARQERATACAASGKLKAGFADIGEPLKL